MREKGEHLSPVNSHTNYRFPRLSPHHCLNAVKGKANSMTEKKEIFPQCLKLNISFYGFLVIIAKTVIAKTITVKYKPRNKNRKLFCIG